MIVPSQKPNVVIRQIATKVSGFEEAILQFRLERIRNEFGLGQFRAVPIAIRKSCAADIDFASDADGNRLQVGVEDKDLRIRDGASERHKGQGMFLVQLIVRRIPGDFGGTVEI